MLIRKMAKDHWGLVLLFVYGALHANGSIIEFGDMIKQLTGKTALPYYTSYGCHCGLGGRGEPLDATDRCCFAHDCCYQKLENCSTTTDKYNYTIVDGNITCGTGSECEEKICDCDKTAAICLRDNLDTYNGKYTLYSDLRCSEKTASC